MTQEKRVLNPTIKAESKKLSANQNLCENYIIFRKNLVKNQAKSLVRVLHNIELFCEMQTTKGENGTGNGLYLCRLLAENKLNGTIEVASFSHPTIFELALKKE